MVPRVQWAHHSDSLVGSRPMAVRGDGIMTSNTSRRNPFRVTLQLLLMACSVAAAMSASANDKTPPEPRFIAYTVQNPSKNAKAVGYNVFLIGVKSDQVDKDKTQGGKFSILRTVRDDPGGVTLFFETPDG